MAKWGKGDPRWIVEERADATNVNNWHWTEKNATGWSQTKLKSLLEGLLIKDDKYECTIKELNKIEGEASANNRKGKLIFFFEWELTGEWKGKLIDSDTSYTGNFEIPNLSEENDADEVDVNVTVKSTNNDADSVKNFMRKTGQDVIRKQLAVYITDLKEEYSKGLIKPSKNSGQLNGSVASKTTPVPKTLKAEMNKPVTSAQKTSQVGVKIDTKNITDKQEFKCRSSELYRSLTEKDMVRAYAGEDSTIEAEKGGRFSLFRGNVTGEFTELTFKELQNKMIETQQQLKVADMQIVTLKRQFTHSKLVESELVSLPAETRTFESIGRMFMLQTKDHLKRNLITKMHTCEDKIKTIEKNKFYLQKVMKETEDNIKELFMSAEKS